MKNYYTVTSTSPKTCHEMYEGTIAQIEKEVALMNAYKKNSVTYSYKPVDIADYKDDLEDLYGIKITDTNAEEIFIDEYCKKFCDYDLDDDECIIEEVKK